MLERITGVHDNRCSFHGFSDDTRRPRAHGEHNIDRHLHEFSGQARHQVVSTICKSLLDDEILSINVAQLRESSPENIEVGALRTGATDLQPADARFPSSLLRLRSRHAEYTYAESNKRDCYPWTSPIHFHGMPPTCSHSSLPQAAAAAAPP